MKITYEKLVKRRVKKTVEIELKPCPFCGGEAKMKFTHAHRGGEWNPKGGVSIGCTHCKVHTPFKSTPDAALVVTDLWNLREGM